jgi:hypothetical protein
MFGVSETGCSLCLRYCFVSSFHHGRNINRVSRHCKDSSTWAWLGERDVGMDGGEDHAIRALILILHSDPRQAPPIRTIKIRWNPTHL